MAICLSIVFQLLRASPNVGSKKMVKRHDMMIRSRISRSPVIPFFKNMTALILSMLVVIAGISASPAAAAQAPHAGIVTLETQVLNAQGTAPSDSADDSVGPSPLVAMAQEVLAQLETVLSPPSTPDYSSAAALAISLSYPSTVRSRVMARSPTPALLRTAETTMRSLFIRPISKPGPGLSI